MGIVGKIFESRNGREIIVITNRLEDFSYDIKLLHRNDNRMRRLRFNSTLQELHEDYKLASKAVRTLFEDTK